MVNHNLIITMKNKYCKDCGETPFVDCGCKTILSTDCVIYQGDEFPDFNIYQGSNLTYILYKIFDNLTLLTTNTQVTNGNNVGTGVKIFKAKNKNKELEFKTIVDTNSIKASDLNSEEVNLNVDENWLKTFITNSTTDTIINSIGDGIPILTKNGNDNNISTIKSNSNDLSITKDASGGVVIENNRVDSFRNVGSGAGFYKGHYYNAHELKTILFEGNGVDIETIEEDEEVKVVINLLPEDPNMTYFYVNAFYNGAVENGSIGKPYKTLQKAIDAFIGNGTATLPEYRSTGVITLQTDVEYSKKIDVNHLAINGNDFIIRYTGIDNYFIDTQHLINVVGRDVNGVLNENIRFNMTDGNIHLINSAGAVRHISLSEGNNNTALYFNNSLKIVDYSYNSYANEFTNVIDKNGNNAVLFGEEILKISTYKSNIPTIYSEGNLREGDGSLSISNLNVHGWGNTNIKLVNTSFSTNSVRSTFNTHRIPYTKLYDNRIPYLQIGLHSLHTENSWFIATEFIDESSKYVEQKTYGDFEFVISQLESMFKIVRTGVVPTKHTGNTHISKAYVYGSAGDHLVIMTKGSELRLLDCDLQTYDSRKGFCKIIPTDTVAEYCVLYLQTCSIKNVKEVDGLVIESPFSTVNGTIFSTYSGYASDIEARASGLIKNNMYYNTTTMSYKKVD